MNQKYLIETAREIPKANEKAVSEYHEKMDFLIASINKIMLSRKDLTQLVGENNVEMMMDNHANHARFIYSILKNPNPDVLVKTILWVFRVYRGHGFSSGYWAAQLNGWMVVLKDQISIDSYLQVIPLYEWMQVNIPVFENLTIESLES